MLAQSPKNCNKLFETRKISLFLQPEKRIPKKSLKNKGIFNIQKINYSLFLPREAENLKK